jgi:hypothetical protein
MRRKHAREMRGAAGTGNQNLQTLIRGVLSKLN